MQEQSGQEREWEHWPGRRPPDESLRNRLRWLFTPTDDEEAVEALITERSREIEAQAERLQSTLREPIVVQNATCFVQASIGLAVYPQDGADAEGLLRSADIAMYRSKTSGRGGITYFEETMNRDAQRRLLVEQRLRVALRSGGLSLAYQAQVDLNDGSFAGVEALARWNDPQLGFVSPVEFIAVAEECGLIDELGTWVLHEACSTYQKLRE